MSLKDSEAQVLQGIRTLDEAIRSVGLAARSLDGLVGVANDAGRALDTDLASPTAHAVTKGREAERLFLQAVGGNVGALRALTAEGAAELEDIEGYVAAAKIHLGNVIDIVLGSVKTKLEQSTTHFRAARERAVTLANILGR